MDAIVSVTRDWAIGKDGRLLVRNKADMHRFVELTRGCTCVMGRKTYESFPGGPLKGRRNVIVTHDAAYVPPKAEDLPAGTTVDVVTSPQAALDATSADARTWLIGGESLYRALLSHCSSCYVTRNDTVVPGADAFFPNLDEDPSWVLAEREDGGVTKAGVAFDFARYDRHA